jgi:hypothetical protein
MEPRAPSTANGKAMQELRGMKFMQRREEATRVAAHTLRLQAAREEAQQKAAEPAVVASSATMSTPARVISLAALPVQSAAMGRSRVAYGFSGGSVGSVSAAPPPPPVPPPTATPAHKADGKTRAPEAESGRRFYPTEGDRAPPLPRAAHKRLGGDDRRAHRDGPDRRRHRTETAGKARYDDAAATSSGDD